MSDELSLSCSHVCDGSARAFGLILRGIFMEWVHLVNVLCVNIILILNMLCPLNISNFEGCTCYVM